jgi:hypothetical protein
MPHSTKVLLLCAFLSAAIGESVPPAWRAHAAGAERTPQRLALGPGKHSAIGDGLSLRKHVQASFSISPTKVATGTTATVTITAPGSLDLGAVQDNQIMVRPSDGVSDVRIVWATAQKLKLSFAINENAATGIRSILIRNTPVALDVAFEPGPTVCPQKCVAPQTCQNNVCVGCNPPCQGKWQCAGSVCRPPPPPPPPPTCPGGCLPAHYCDDSGYCRPGFGPP